MHHFCCCAITTPNMLYMPLVVNITRGPYQHLQVGYKVPWTAVSSLLHQFNQHFQEPRVLLWLNLAYFLPSVPALLLHSSVQDVLEARLGVAKAGAARLVGLKGLKGARCVEETAAGRCP